MLADKPIDFTFEPVVDRGPHGGPRQRRRLLPPHQRGRGQALRSRANVALHRRRRVPRPAPRDPPPARRAGSAAEEYHSAPLPPAQEAAVLYAANMSRPRRGASSRAETRDPASRSQQAALAHALRPLRGHPEPRRVRRPLAALHGALRAVAARLGRRRRGRPGPAAHPEPRAQGLLRPEAQQRWASSPRRSRSSSPSRSRWGRCGSTSARSPSITASEAALLAAALQRLRRANLPDVVQQRRVPRARAARRLQRARLGGHAQLLAAALRALRAAGQDASPSRSSGSSTPSPSRCRPPSGRCT